MKLLQYSSPPPPHSPHRGSLHSQLAYGACARQKQTLWGECSPPPRDMRRAHSRIIIYHVPKLMVAHQWKRNTCYKTMYVSLLVINIVSLLVISIVNIVWRHIGSLGDLVLLLPLLMIIKRRGTTYFTWPPPILEPLNSNRSLNLIHGNEWCLRSPVCAWFNWVKQSLEHDWCVMVAPPPPP